MQPYAVNQIICLLSSYIWRHKMSNDTVLSLFQPLWTISRIVGLANRKLRLTSSQPKLRSKILRYVYNVVVIFITFIITDTTTTFKLSNNRRIIIREFTNTIWALAKGLSLCTTITLSMRNQDNFQQLLRRLDNVDKRMKKCGMWIDYKNLKIWVITEVIGVVVLLLFYFVFYNFLYYRIVVSHFDRTKTIIRWCLVYIPILTMHIFLMQFTTIVLVMAKQSATVNRCIINLKRSQTFDKHLMLSELRDIYTHLGKTKQELNTLYSLILLVKFWNQLINVFVCTYHCVYGYGLVNIIVKPKNVVDYFVPLFASIVIFIEFGIIIIVCEKMSMERRKTAKCLHQLMVTNFNENIQRIVSLIKRLHLRFLVFVIRLYYIWLFDFFCLLVFLYTFIR